jgi:hypothetical protein
MGWYREPFVHFLLLGVTLFGLYQWLGDRGDAVETTREIIVSPGRIESLAVGFTRTWQRPPTDTELERLIQDYIREEVYYREAMALGLDRDDTIIRRRLRQKLEFVTDDVAAQVEPTDEQLRDYLQEHPEAFRTERRFTFTQVYLNPQRRGDRLARDAAQLLVTLQQAGVQADVSMHGDSFLLEHQFDSVLAREVTQQFGEQFMAQLAELPVGQWQGPIESGYGVHLVCVIDRTEGDLPRLEEVRDAVRRAWANAQRLEANEQFYQTLLQRYTVSVEKPQPPEGETQTAEVRR